MSVDILQLILNNSLQTLPVCCNIYQCYYILLLVIPIAFLMLSDGSVIITFKDRHADNYNVQITIRSLNVGLVQ